jgi:glycosyltransferase involved in cell wall biosynthesis
MAHADLVLQTSESEGVSRILRETMLLGIPIVSFAIPGTTDILTNQEDSILVQPFDIKKVAEAILFLLNNNDTYNKISQRSQKRYYLNHSKSNYYNNLISQINKITEESNEYQRTNY